MSRRLLIVLWAIGGLIGIVLLTSIIEKNRSVRPCNAGLRCFDLFEIFKNSKSYSSIITPDSQLTIPQHEFAIHTRPPLSANKHSPPVIQGAVTEKGMESKADSPALNQKKTTTLAYLIR